MPAAGARDPPVADLPLLRDVAAQLVDVLVVDLLDLLLAEVTGLPLDGPGLRPLPAALPFRPLVGLLCHFAFLERDVVVDCRTAEVGVRTSCGSCGNVRVLAAELAAAAEELHGVGDHLDRLALGAVLRLPLAPLETAVDRDRTSLGEVLRAVFALGAPDRDVEVVGLLGPLTGGRILAACVHGEPEAADRHPARRVPELRVAGQVADEHDAIDAGHALLLLFR